MPIPIQQNEEAFVPSEGGPYTVIPEDWYPARIFKSELKYRNNNQAEPFLAITFRIQETEYDGEDVTVNFVALYGKARFNIYNIAKAIGPEFLAQYWDGKAFTAYPSPDELQGQSLLIQVENNFLHASEKPASPGGPRVPKFNNDGTPKIILTNEVTDYAQGDPAPRPNFRKRLKADPALVAAQAAANPAATFGGAPSGAGAFQAPADPSAVFGGQPAATAATQGAFGAGPQGPVTTNQFGQQISQ